MKKILTLLTASIFGVTALTSCNRPGLVIANWGYFENSDLIAEFEEKHDIRVRITRYNSNSQAIGLMEQGNRFDIVIPSEYAVAELAHREMIRQIDWDLLEEHGFKANMFHENLIEKLYAEEDRFDLLKYGVPYKWGQLGILYNTVVPGIYDMLNAQQWNIFNYQPLAVLVQANNAAEDVRQARAIGFYESAQDGFAAALSATNSDLNSDVGTELDAAASWLNQMTERHGDRIVFAGDEFHQTSADGRYAILQKFSGCAALIIDTSNTGVNYGFFVPEETYLFVNSMVIPTRARNVEMAHKFIAFMSQQENAVRNSAATWYTSTIQTSFDHLVGNEDLELNNFDWFGTPTDGFGIFSENVAFNSVIDYVSEGHVFFDFTPGRRADLTLRWAQLRA